MQLQLSRPAVQVRAYLRAGSASRLVRQGLCGGHRGEKHKLIPSALSTRGGVADMFAGGRAERAETHRGCMDRVVRDSKTLWVEAIHWELNKVDLFWGRGLESLMPSA
ncbi:hypothetical protein FB451DRAFT_1166257 [Mycena latifolia]|nr:hypothetical protein FB451DRAFT_1166257 [Mycena latifolia]